MALRLCLPHKAALSNRGCLENMLSSKDSKSHKRKSPNKAPYAQASKRWPSYFTILSLIHKMGKQYLLQRIVIDGRVLVRGVEK